MAQRQRADHVDVLVVGAGFAGMYQLRKARELGLRVRVVERGDGVGGTWYWNRYPGARCDAPSLFYSVSYRPDLDQEWHWSERFAGQAEILAYMREVARREGMERDISFGTNVVRAEWSPGSGTWTVTTDAGERIRARYVVLATGCLSQSRVPEIPGLERFRGRWFHTGRWPHEPVQLAGRRVAVVGTGSTGAQVIPAVAEVAEQVTVFQRTPKFVLPARNRPMSEADARPVKDAYPALRAAARQRDYGMPTVPIEHRLAEMPPVDRDALMERMYEEGALASFVYSYADHLGLKNQAVNDLVADFVRGKIREVVHDPGTAEALTPYGYPIGINRIILGTGYYESFNRDNVVLHDARTDPIAELTENGLRTAGDAEYTFDDLIFATGYDGITGSFTAIDVRDGSGGTLKDAWADGPRAYLGLQVAGFPNLFTITGPGSPSVLANVITTIEQHVEFVTDLIAHAHEHGAEVVEADAAAEEKWMEHVADVAQNTLFRHAAKANSWYAGANVPGKRVVFMPYAGGVGTFDAILTEVAADGYRGFRLGGGVRDGATEPPHDRRE
jgi:cation diffusion facilitator CzcD-associated flavoprotein CzcO